jgi:hypothetical protein
MSFNSGSEQKKDEAPLEFRSGPFDEQPTFRSLQIDHENTPGGGMRGISAFDQEVTRSLGVMAPAGDAAPSFWGASEGSADMSALGDLAMPSFGNKSSSFGQEPFFAQPQKTSSKQGFDQFTSTSFTQGSSRAATLQEIPVYVEKYTSFYSSTPAPDMLLAICSHLASVNVDHEYVPNKSKIKGVCFTAGGRVSFHVRCYKTTTPGDKCLVEFQRRCGSCTDFSAFYRGCVEKFNKHITNPYMQASNKDKAPFFCRPDDTEEVVVLNEDTVKALCEMAVGPHMEMQRESIQALASLAASQTNQKKLLEFASTNNTCAIPCLMKVLDSVLSSGDETTARYGALLLAQISKQEHARPKLASHTPLVASMLALLDAPAALSNRDTKRQVSCALASLSTGNEEAVALLNVPDCCLTEVLEKYRHVGDDVLRTNVCRTLSQFAKCS